VVRFDGFDPGSLLLLNTYSVEPSALTVTVVGYQPVGTKAATLCGAGPDSGMMARSLAPPLVT
jgi:hypothetical protein